MKGLGEPLPKKVAQQWSEWCIGKGYVKVHLDKTGHKYNFENITMPSLWVHTTDDNIANFNNVKEMIDVYPNIQSKIITINPKEYGFTQIGHMSFFSKKKSKLWHLALDWINKY